MCVMRKKSIADPAYRSVAKRAANVSIRVDWLDAARAAGLFLARVYPLGQLPSGYQTQNADALVVTTRHCGRTRSTRPYPTTE